MNILLLLPLLFINSIACGISINECEEMICEKGEPAKELVMDEVNFFTPLIFLNN